MKKTVIVKWKIKTSATTEVLKMLPELVARTRNEPGNISYAIYQSETDPSELMLHEEYADADALEAHKKSEPYQRLVVQEIIPRLEKREVTLATRLF